MSKKHTEQKQRTITGQVMYMGPRIQHLGLGYAALFRDGIHPTLYESIKQCPAIGEMFVPVAEIGRVRRELNFDYAHNMKGTVGKHVTFFREIQQWIARHQQQPKPSGVTLKTHHA